MSSFDVGTAFVTVVPDATKFRALLQAQVTAAVNAVSGSVAISPVLASAGSATGTSATASVAAASAVKNLREVDRASKQAAQGLLSASQESKILQGSIVGLSRITPVAVFGLGVAGSAAIAAGLAFKSAISSAADFEQQLNTFQAVTKATASDMEAIRSSAIALGADISLPAISAGDAADALTELAKAGLSVEDSLAAARGVLQLSSAASITAGQAAQIAATQLNAFQLAGSDATRVAELLADASVSAQGEITDFAAAFGQASAVANQVGLSIEDTTGLLTQLGQAGLQGADGGTSLRTALLRLVPTTKEARQFTEALGIQIDKTKSIGEQIVPIIEQYRTQLEKLTPVQQQEVLTQIFGQDAIRAASILFTQQEGALRTLTDEFARNNSIQDLSAAKAKGLKGAFGSLQSTFETIGIELGGIVSGPLEGLIRGFTNSVIGTEELIKGLGDLIALPDIVKTVKVVFDFDLPGGGNLGDAIKSGLFVLPTALANLAPDDVAPSGPPMGPFFGETRQRGPGEDAIAAAKAAIRPVTAAEKAARERIEELLKKFEEEREKPDLALDIPRSLQQDLIDAQLNDSLQQELKADNAIIDFFEKRLGNIKEGTEKFLVVSGQLAQAQDARDSVAAQIANQQQANASEQKRIAGEATRASMEQAAAQEQLRETILNIEQQRLGNRLSFALSTPTTSDEKRIYNLQIERFQRLKKEAERLRNAAKNGSQEQKDAQLEIEKLNGQIIGTRILIKNLGQSGDSGGGSSLSDLFKEAIGQFNEFGSNVSSSPMTPGQARGSFAGNLVTSIIDSKESKTALGIGVVGKNTSDTNVLLAQLIRLLGGEPQSGTIVESGAVGSVTARNARRFKDFRHA